MGKFLSVAALAVGAVGLLLMAPAQSRADGIRHGYDCGYGGYSSGYGPGYGYGGYRGSSGANYGYGGYGGYYDRGYSGYGGYYGRPVIDHPRTIHVTPFRGVHAHGHIHVPHRGHYHRQRY